MGGSLIPATLVFPSRLYYSPVVLFPSNLTEYPVQHVHFVMSRAKVRIEDENSSKSRLVSPLHQIGFLPVAGDRGPEGLALEGAS